MSNIGFQAKPLSRADIRRFAIKVRRALGYGDDPYIDVEEVLEFVMPKVLPGFAFGVGTMAEMGNNHGLADPEHRYMMLREDVFQKACDGEGRDRLTVMHEVGHLLLHTKDRIVLRRGTGKPKAYCDPEWQANCFAGELLVAHSLIRQFKRPLEVASAFGVSLDAARFQLERFSNDGVI